MRGRDNYLGMQQAYPEGWHIEVLGIVDGGDTVVSEVRVEQAGKRFFAVSFFELEDGKIVRAVEYWSDGEPEPAPAWRAPLDGAALSALEIRHAEPADHARVIAVLDEWWGGRRMGDMLPKLFFVHFRETSFVAERDGELAGFLVGFLSQAQPEEAYVHFVGVSPAERGTGLGRELYERFFAVARRRGRIRVSCVTSPRTRARSRSTRRSGSSPRPRSPATTARARTGSSSRIRCNRLGGRGEALRRASSRGASCGRAFRKSSDNERGSLR